MSKLAGFVLLCLVLFFVVGSAVCEDSAGLEKSYRQVRQKVLGKEVLRLKAAEKLRAAGVRPGDWYRIGPFRDQGPLLNWMDNVESSFAAEFAVESETLGRGGKANLRKRYKSANFPATPDAVRRWELEQGWIDGYYQELPRGPAPSAGESQYVYREITAESPVEIEIDFVLRSPESDRRMNDKGMEYYRRTGRFRWWVNGVEMSSWQGRGDMPFARKVMLKKGVNYFLAKVTNNRHAYGFAFSIFGYGPDMRHEVGFERFWKPLPVDRASDVPYFIESVERDDWFVKGADWVDSFALSYNGLWQKAKKEAVVFADFAGDDFGQWQVVKGDAFGDGPKEWKGAMGVVSTMDKEVDRHSEGSVLRSNGFTIDKRYLLVRMESSGGGRSPRLRVIIEKDAGGKVVENQQMVINTLNQRRYIWSVLDMRRWKGAWGYIEILNKHKGSYGHVAVDKILFSDRCVEYANNAGGIWGALLSEYKGRDDRFEIRLAAQAVGREFDKFFIYDECAEIDRMLAEKVNGYIGRWGGRFDAKGLGAREVIDRAGKIAMYAESLERLLGLKFHPEPVAGVEHAAIDSKGRIVPAMEKELEKYPSSAAGQKHVMRRRVLERKVSYLIGKVVGGNELMVDQVNAVCKKLDDMWAESISRIGPLVFLERDTYRYDSMQFTRSGAGNASVRVFDPGSGEVRTLFDIPGGYRAHEISLSWDGKRIFVGGGGKVYSVGVDGQGLTSITSGQSPCEMPDGRVVFFDDDAGQSPCKSDGARRLLFICDADGKNRRVVSANLTIDNSPAIMNDGKVIFARWDYGVNKNVFNRHALWMQNPDGTGLDLYFGNTVIDPRAFYRPRQVPGRPEVLSVFGPHHVNVAGLVGLVWNGRGKEACDGLGFRRLTADTASIGDQGTEWAFQDAVPLNEQIFLVSYGGRFDRKVGLYLLDRAGNRKCILETAGTRGVHSAQIFAKRDKPHVIPDRSVAVNWTPSEDLHARLLSDPDWSKKATLIMQDVYQGLEPEIERGEVKYLAVMEQVAQSHVRGGAMGVGTIWYANRCVGLVEVEKDGSAYFEVPALRSLYFHVLDKDGRMLMTQGSDFHTMPGEVRSCVGCHEQRNGDSAPVTVHGKTAAVGKKPVRPVMPKWGTNGIIEYESVVQPVFDKYCVSCHSGAMPKGRLDLSGDRTVVYNMSYMQLAEKRLVHFTPGTGATHAQPSNDSDIQAPLSRGAILSKLADNLANPGHSGSDVPFDEKLKVYLWIDSNVPFYSHYRQKSPTVLKDEARGKLLAVYNKRCSSCHGQGGRADAQSGLNKYHSWVHIGGRPGQWGIAESGMRVHQMNLSNPANSAVLQGPLSRDAGGWGLCVDGQGGSVFVDKDDPDYVSILKALEQVEYRDGMAYEGVKQLLAK